MPPTSFDPADYIIGPHLGLSGPQAEAFESLCDWCMSASGGALKYDLPYPMHQFLAYLGRRRPVLMHGTNDAGISRFEPQEQVDYFGRPCVAVFATADPIVPLYFAVVDRAKVKVMRNVFFEAEVGGERRMLYQFMVPEAVLPERPWTDGAVYVVPRHTFTRVHGPDGRPSHEWTSEVPVEPLAYLPVRPADFPYLSRVRGFRLRDMALPIAVARARKAWRRLWSTIERR